MFHLRLVALLVVCLALFLGPATSQDLPASPPLARNRLIPSADLLADLAILRQAYEEMHPGLYRYNSRAEMDARFDRLRAEFSRDRTLADAYLALSVFAAQIRCGHTYPNFFNQKKAVAAALFKGQDRVPFYFRWLRDEIVVIQDFTPDHTLPRGTRILSINGIPARRILARLLTIARADGSNDAKRRSYLEVTGDSEFEAFDVYFPLFFPPANPNFQLRVRRPGSAKAASAVVQALTWEQRIAPIHARETGRREGDAVLFDWTYLSDGSAWLRMPTWALYDSKWDWKSWLNSRLDQLADRNAPALIVDLRGNEGGNDVGDELIKRLVRSDLKLASYRRLVRYRSAPAALIPYLDTWDPSFKDWGTYATDLPSPWPTAPPVPYFGLTRFDDDASGNEVIPAAGKPFHGKLIVLIDASNSSATFQFARLVREQHLGTLIGQPTGGSLRGINGGAFFFLRLPHSQLEMDLPLIGTFPASPQPDSGLTPDLLVTPSVADIANDRDPVLEAARHLAAKP
ncbi:MAG TPA: S41 family peptidase [Dongiaceae bacterium]|nr:S41 family peptidase [Dongiaceae bacterium]